MQGCGLVVMNTPPALMMLVLKLPQRPLSDVTMMTSVRLLGPGRPILEQRVERGVDARGDAAQHALHLNGVGTRVDDPLLRAAQLRRGDHLHRLGDLLRVLHRPNAAPEINQ